MHFTEYYLDMSLRAMSDINNAVSQTLFTLATSQPGRQFPDRVVIDLVRVSLTVSLYLVLK